MHGFIVFSRRPCKSYPLHMRSFLPPAPIQQHRQHLQGQQQHLQGQEAWVQHQRRLTAVWSQVCLCQPPSTRSRAFAIQNWVVKIEQTWKNIYTYSVLMRFAKQSHHMTDKKGVYKLLHSFFLMCITRIPAIQEYLSKTPDLEVQSLPRPCGAGRCVRCRKPETTT